MGRWYYGMWKMIMPFALMKDIQISWIVSRNWQTPRLWVEVKIWRWNCGIWKIMILFDPIFLPLLHSMKLDDVESWNIPEVQYSTKLSFGGSAWIIRCSRVFLSRYLLLAILSTVLALRRSLLKVSSGLQRLLLVISTARGHHNGHHPGRAHE